LVVCLLAGLAPLLWPPSAQVRVPPRPSSPATRPRPARPLARPPTAWWRGAPTRGRRPEATYGEVADALVLIALCLRAGLPLTAALHHVQAGATGVVRDDLAAVVAALRWGLPAREAWAYAGAAWRPAATASHLAEQTGAAAAELLDGAAARMREQGERAGERAAARAGVLLVLPLGLGFLPAFACTAVVPVVVNLASGVLAGGS
jgi:Flp pilus assembly protein TadB